MKRRLRLRLGDVVRAAVIAAGIALLIVVFFRGYWADWEWTGFGGYPITDTYRLPRSLWDWLGLLIVPAVLAVGGYLFNRSEREQAQMIADQRRKEERRRALVDRIRENRRAELQKEMEQYRADQKEKLDREFAAAAHREDALQHYLDGMTSLILDRGLSQGSAHNLRDVARVKTLTVLSRLGEDGERKGSIIRFLTESTLITTKNPAISLQGAELSHSSLGVSDLHWVNLTRTTLIGALFVYAKLDQADLSGCRLEGANFYGASLIGADLTGSIVSSEPLGKRHADMRRADLSNAQLLSTQLNYADLTLAKLPGANLTRASLIGANLSEADLTGADLTKADLTDAIVTEEQLSKAKSLSGATMPDGTVHQ